MVPYGSPWCTWNRHRVLIGLYDCPLLCGARLRPEVLTLADSTSLAPTIGQKSRSQYVFYIMLSVARWSCGLLTVFRRAQDASQEQYKAVHCQICVGVGSCQGSKDSTDIYTARILPWIYKMHRDTSRAPCILCVVWTWQTHPLRESRPTLMLSLTPRKRCRRLITLDTMRKIQVRFGDNICTRSLTCIHRERGGCSRKSGPDGGRRRL